MIAFPPMNALHLILDHLDKLHALCHDQSCRTDSFLHDGHFVCANHCISECRLCLLILHVPHTGDTWEYLDCAMPSTSSNYKSVHDNRFHGDEDHDPRSDLSQGGGDDAEHPTFIPMYTPTTLQAPRIHKMRPRLYTIGHKVNSLLFEPSLSICECSDPTSDGQASVYLCHPWISMLAHTVHQCIYQSAITCINNVK